MILSRNKSVKFTPELWKKWVEKRQREADDDQTKKLREGIEEMRRMLND